MKKYFGFIAIALLLGIFTTACEQSDCLCRYYDANGQEIARDSWDGEDINASECESKENTTQVEIDDEIIATSSVSCAQEW